MKGLSTTLSIVIIAIVLLVTALVIMTIFGGSMANIIGILNPWSKEMLETNLCQQKCAAYCQANPETTGTDWINIKIQRKDDKGTIILTDCAQVLGTATGQAGAGKCGCKGIPTTGGGTTPPATP